MEGTEIKTEYEDQDDLFLPFPNVGTTINNEMVSENIENLFVCTTRLDDMPIFQKDLHALNVKDIISHIENDSKPKIYYLPKYTPPSKTSFQGIINKINLVNEKAAVLQRNEQLLKLCKPLKVVLYDYRKLQINVQAEPNKNHEFDFSKVNNSTSVTFKNLNVTKQSKAKSLVLYNSSSREYEIYNFGDMSTLTGYCKTNKSPDENLSDAKFTYCCWYERNNVLNILQNTILKQYSASIFRFLTTRHECNFGQCKCCCCPKGNGKSIFDQGTVSNSITKKSKKSTSCLKPLFGLLFGIGNISNEVANTWRDQLLTELNHDSLISKALRYNRKRNQVNEILLKDENRSLSYIMQFKYFPQSVIRNIMYYIDKSGNVLAYEKSQRDLNKNISKSLITSFTPCCWVSHREIVDSFLSRNIKPSSVRFMRLPHRCEYNNCRCCCKDCIFTVYQGTESTKTKHSKQKVETDKSIINLDEDNTEIEFENDCTEINSEDHNTKNNYETNNINTNSEINNTNINSETNNSNINSEKNNININSETDNTHINTEKSSEVSVDVLINTILERFKDVKLSINADGRVAVALNTPVTSLSSAELKVLSQILSHAQKTVSDLGIRAGSNTVMANNNNNTITGDNIFNNLEVNINTNMTANPQSQSSPASKSNTMTKKPKILNYFLDNENKTNKPVQTHVTVKSTTNESSGVKLMPMGSIAGLKTNPVQKLLPIAPAIQNTPLQVYPSIISCLQSKSVFLEHKQKAYMASLTTLNFKTFYTENKKLMQNYECSSQNEKVNDPSNTRTENKLWYKKPEDSDVVKKDNNLKLVKTKPGNKGKPLKRKSNKQTPLTNKIRVLSPTKLGAPKNLTDEENAPIKIASVCSFQNQLTIPVTKLDSSVIQNNIIFNAPIPVKDNIDKNDTPTFLNEFVAMTQSRLHDINTTTVDPKNTLVDVPTFDTNENFEEIPKFIIQKPVDKNQLVEKGPVINKSTRTPRTYKKKTNQNVTLPVVSTVMPEPSPGISNVTVCSSAPSATPSNVVCTPVFVISHLPGVSRTPCPIQPIPEGAFGLLPALQPISVPAALPVQTTVPVHNEPSQLNPTAVIGQLPTLRQISVPATVPITALPVKNAPTPVIPQVLTATAPVITPQVPDSCGSILLKQLQGLPNKGINDETSPLLSNNTTPMLESIVIDEDDFADNQGHHSYVAEEDESSNSQEDIILGM